MLHSNFTVLVTGVAMSKGVAALSALGATTVFEPMDTVLATIRMGATSRLCADVIVVDGTVSRGNVLLGDGMQRAARLTEALATLSDIYVMPNGVRWSALPIVLVGDDEALGEVIRADLKFKHVEYVSRWCGLSTRDPWSVVYKRARSRYLQFGPELAESLRSLGMLLQEERGLILRAGVRDGVLRHAVENSFYDGRQDAWFRAGSAALRQLLSPLFTGEDATARAIVDLEALASDRCAKEDRPERIMCLHPCLMDIAQYEAHPQFSFVGSDGKRVRIDLLSHSYGVERGRPPSGIWEFKRGGFPMLRHRAFTSALGEGVMQTVDYGEQISAKSASIERRLGGPLGSVTRTVVGGRARGAEPVRLARARAATGGARVIGWDEVAIDNRRRFRIPEGWQPDSVE